MSRKRRFGTFDLETDPFFAGRFPEPFAGCIYFGDRENWVVWGDDCIPKLVDILRELPETDLYVHNGGKFDLWWLLPHCDRGEITIINGRIAIMRIGRVKLIDSYLLIPFALAKFRKTEIDYDMFERDVREANREEIVKYLIDDCRDLFDLVAGFHAKLGKKLTIGAAALNKVKESGAKVEKHGKSHDAAFRKYYFGGRVEAIKPGVHSGNFVCIDINSAYPAAMMLKHPCGPLSDYKRSKKMPPLKELGPQFITLLGVSRGALPLRLASGNLAFPTDELPRQYNVTGWEVKAGLDTGTLEVIEVQDCLTPGGTRSFAAFVLNEYAARLKARTDEKLLDELVHKTVLNSAYGKFATNPDNFAKWEISEPGVLIDGYSFYSEGPGYWLHKGEVDENEKERGYVDVAVGASITGSVRATLWRALCKVKEPYYCDTDSIICKSAGGLELHDDKLGAWKVEVTGTELAIAGKKLYALRGGKKKKMGSKGVRLDDDSIFEIAAGRMIEWESDVPSHSLKRGRHFTKRKISKT